jgi:hypothetical protein
VKKNYTLTSYDKNVLIRLMKLGGRCKALELHAAIPEISWEQFAKYLKRFERKSQCIIIANKDRVDRDTIIKADLEVEMSFRI